MVGPSAGVDLGGVDDGGVDDDAATVGDTSAAELATGTGADPAAIELGVAAAG